MTSFDSQDPLNREIGLYYLSTFPDYLVDKPTRKLISKNILSC